MFTGHIVRASDYVDRAAREVQGFIALRESQPANSGPSIVDGHDARFSAGRNDGFKAFNYLGVTDELRRAETQATKMVGMRYTGRFVDGEVIVDYFEITTPNGWYWLYAIDGQIVGICTPDMMAQMAEPVGLNTEYGHYE